MAGTADWGVLGADSSSAPEYVTQTLSAGDYGRTCTVVTLLASASCRIGMNRLRLLRFGCNRVGLAESGIVASEKPPKSSFGERLFALRTARGLTQVDLAQGLGTTQRGISYYRTNGDL